MNNINEKIDKLREYALKNNSDFENELNDWTERVEKVEQIKEYREFDLSKQISKTLVSICLLATKKLIREKDLVERARLEADLDRCKWLLKFYNKSPDDILSSIEDEINQDLIKFELN